MGQQKNIIEAKLMSNFIQLNIPEIITDATGCQGVINPIIIFYGDVMGELSNTNI